MRDFARFLAEHRLLTRRHLIKLGAGSLALSRVGSRLVQAGPGADDAATGAATAASPAVDSPAPPALGDGVKKIESLLTPQKLFYERSRGEPLPHSLPEEKKREVGLTRETWQLEVISDPEHPVPQRNALTKEKNRAFKFEDLMKLADKHAVRFAKAMTCLNLGCPLGLGIWEGVPLREVIWLTEPRDNCRRVFYYGYHNDQPEQMFRSSLPIGRVFEDPYDLPPVILCYKLNGEWLTPERGGPVRVLTHEVTVRAPRELLKTDSATISTVIHSRLISDLPLDGRNFFELTLLAPGVMPPAPGSAGTVRGDFAVSVQGARDDANVFLLDGVYNGDPKLNGIGVTPSVDAVREFEVLTNTYDASFGRNAGGQVNVITRSGSNELHGTAFAFTRNGILDARNYFDRQQGNDPGYQRNQFGASLGLPVRKDRTFLFGDFEGRRVREAIPRIANVPTALERQGDFSQSSQSPIDLFTGAPFSGNRMPASRLDPIGLALAGMYPLPNRSQVGQNFFSSPDLNDRADTADLRFDQQISSRSELAVRYSFGDRRLYDPFSGPSYSLVPGFGTNVLRRAQNLMVSETHVFTPALIAEFRVAYNRVAQGTFHENQGQDLNRQVGLPTLSSQARDTGLSFISLPGFSPLGDEYNNPQHSVSETWQGLGQFSLQHGRGLLKFGGAVGALRQNAYRDVLSRGMISFLGLSQNPVGDLLQGFVTYSVGARLDNPQNLRSRSFSLFAHDTFRLSSSLVVSAGVRYEFSTPPFDAFDRANIYDPAFEALRAVGKDGFPRGGYDQDRNNMAPRFGIAWSPRDCRTVVRAGYGIYYDQSPLAPGEGLYFNSPYFESKTYFPFAGYPLLLKNPFPADFPIPVPASGLAIQRDLRTAYLQHWSFSIQQQTRGNGVLEIAYVGSKGTKLLSARDMNQPLPTQASPNPRPDARFDDINILESRGISAYHSLQTRFQQRFHQRYSLLIAHTWGRAIDDASSFFTSSGDPNFPQDSRNTRAERGRSSFDMRQRLSVAYSVDLPFGRGLLRSGWQTNGIWTFQTGRPFTVALHPDFDNSNTGRSTLGFGANDRPNVIANPTLSNPSPARWFDTGAFQVPAYGSFGNAGRNILEGPGLGVGNVSIVKETPLSESTRLQLRMEVFNVLNRTNFDLPGNFIGTPNFGRILSAGQPRRFQFGVKLLF